MVKIESGGSGFFRINGVPYQRGNYEIVTDSSLTRLGIRRLGTRGFDMDFIVGMTAADQFTDNNDVSFNSISQLISYLEGFFFRDIAAVNPSSLTTYRAEDYDQLVNDIAQNPSQGETAFIINSQGTKWLPGPLFGTWYDSGLYYYDGSRWMSDKEEIARQLDINVNELDAIESVNANQDSLISVNTSNISQNTSDIADKADSSIQIAGVQSVFGGGDLTQNRTFSLLNDLATPSNAQVYGMDFTGVRGWKNTTALVSNNAGQIKLNWAVANRPSSPNGFTANTVQQIPLNSNYTVSASPTTIYPYLASVGIGGQNVISNATQYLRELLAGQSIVYRVSLGFSGKAQGKNGRIAVTMYNPNPASNFSITKSLSTPDGTTTIEQEFDFIAIADSFSLNSSFGYAFEAETSFSDGNLLVYITSITALYNATDLFNKTN